MDGAARASALGAATFAHDDTGGGVPDPNLSQRMRLEFRRKRQGRQRSHRRGAHAAASLITPSAGSRVPIVSDFISQIRQRGGARRASPRATPAFRSARSPYCASACTRSGAHRRWHRPLAAGTLDHRQHGASSRGDSEMTSTTDGSLIGSTFVRGALQGSNCQRRHRPLGVRRPRRSDRRAVSECARSRAEQRHADRRGRRRARRPPRRSRLEDAAAGKRRGRGRRSEGNSGRVVILSARAASVSCASSSR